MESHFALPIPLNALTAPQPEMPCSDARASTNCDCHSVLPTSIILTMLPVPSCANKFTASILE